MKKMLALTVMLAGFLVAGPAAASTSYDFILKDKGVKNWNNIYINNVKQAPLMMDYLNLIVSERNIVRTLERDGCEKEIVRFARENTRIITMFVHMLIIQNLSKSEVSDNELMFVTGIIKDPRAQVAKTGPEYEMEKQGWRSMYVSYATWEALTQPGNITKLVEKAFHSMKKTSTK